MRQKRAFEKIAPYYDILMKGITYKEWVNYTLELFDLIDQRPQRILDMACGTGVASLELARRGFEVTAMDISPHMLDALKKKRGAEKLEIVQANMVNFILPHKVDAVTCYFDSLNYLTEERLLKRCFTSVNGALAQPGVFIFDMNTVYGLEKVWGTNTLIREYDDIYSVWKSVFDATCSVSTLYLTMFVKNGSNYTRIDEIHQERAYPLHEIKRMLEDAGFTNIRIFGHMTTSAFLDISSRIMIIAQKLS
ncbi:methyltransferase domain-containing protein [candidate division WOR-3 bacterium]|uniref:Methyltransferase domain-containing protein n=1 Tax=candidate division WOR-3 bacterium TaxID=2052148 RepID=A0A9D5KDK3_UNCW3|nr:methyltransferase domain-containing protein [candidate division WOR-3 bacterium]MBD3365556.1 methyltransferase domain-containing protein [candidate division WOR-3 bacterium]